MSNWPVDGFLMTLVLAPFVSSLVAAFLPTNARTVEAWLAGATSFVLLVIALRFYPALRDGQTFRYDMAWAPEIGLMLTLRLDGFAWLFAVLISGIGFLVVLYARYYMSADDPVPRFFSFLLAFMGSMMGVVLSGNLIQLVFFWELTSLFSFLLIGYWHQNATARDGARMALTVTGTGGLCLFFGVLLLGNVAGSYDLDRVLEAANEIREHWLLTPIVILVCLGALTKSAQFPFHFWLPHAMAAPTPVSAYLHSATMVKAGVFLLARLWPVMAGTDPWFFILCGTGAATLLLGSYCAIFQQDTKGLLAYSTISHLGLITILLGIGSPLAAVAAIFHIMNHAAFKASLFMAAGIIDHETGTRDINRLSGLRRSMPATAALAMVASAAMAGVPLLNGFLSKEMFFAETIIDYRESLLDRSLPYVAALAGIFSVAYSLRFIHGVFFGPDPSNLPRQPHEPPYWMRFPVELLVIVCLVIGIIPSLTIGPVLKTAVHAVLKEATPEYDLAVWHGVNLPLAMSVVAMIGGVVLYFALQRYLATGAEGAPYLRHLKGQRIFERVLVTVSWKWARPAAEFLGTHRLQPQMRLVAVCALAVAVWGAYRNGWVGQVSWPSTPFDPAFVLVWTGGIACAVGAAYQARYHRLVSILLLGGVGLSVCLTFVWFSAPDLALTQLLVEVVTTVLLLLGLRWLPKRSEDIVPQGSALIVRYRRLRDLALAVTAGLGMFALSYAMMTRPPVKSASQFFLERAYTDGGGRNVVNVILVDFRGFDTMGEIVVLCVVALSVYALLRRFRPARESIDAPLQQRLQDAYDDERPDRKKGDTVADYLMIPAMTMQLLFPVIAVVAVYLFLRGHDWPGGGFVAGLTLSVAFILQYMAGGTYWAEARLRILPLRWMGLGILMALATGAGAWAFGRPFLTSFSAHGELPLLGDVPFATALFFDLGVFLLVVGATVLVLIALAHQSIRNAKSQRSTKEGTWN